MSDEPCEKCAAQEAKATSAWNMWNVACHDIARLQKACAAKATQIVRLKECQASQREQLRLLEDLQDGEIAEHVRLAEESKDKEIAKLTAALAAADEMVAALDRCEANRGRFSCTPAHDCRCEKDRVISGECTCGADELDEAVRSYRTARGGTR